MVSISVMSSAAPWAQRIRSGSSAALSCARATVLILTCRPAAWAASMPASTLARSPPRVSGGTGPGFSVSSETLIRLTPASARWPRELGQLGAVGGQGQLVQRARFQMARQALDQPHHALAHQGLAAGQAQLLRAQADEGRGDAVQLLERQHLGLRQEGHVLGHAVDAAQVAAVGDRHAQIGHRAAEASIRGREARLGLRRGGVVGRHAALNIERNAALATGAALQAPPGSGGAGGRIGLAASAAASCWRPGTRACCWRARWPPPSPPRCAA